jgi:fatty-acyl-CoA synthase
MTLPHACLAPRNDTAARETTAGDVLIGLARRTPYRIALTDVCFPGALPRSWTCEALRDDAAMLAVALLSRFAPGERIAVWAAPCSEAVLLQFAAAFAGLTLVTIDPACHEAELTRILDHSRAVGLFMSIGEWGGAPRRCATSASARLREVVDLADRRTLFVKRGRVDGLPEVRPHDLAQIRYAAGGHGPLRGEAVLEADLADALHAAIAGAGPRADALLPYFPNGPSSAQPRFTPPEPPISRMVAIVF